ncbi:MAG: EsaB/YukD family protein [Lachnospiraceae bacterium]|nr:EsaB/YukD family protein [Lachnospiraceae bacterium]
MVLVEVYVPAVDEHYEFMLDECVIVRQIVEEIAEMLARKIKNKVEGDNGVFMLCSMDHQRILEMEKTLADCHIKDGSRLLLV